MQSFMPAGLSPGADAMDADTAPTQGSVSTVSEFEVLPSQDGETEEEAWLREQGNAPSRMDPEVPQQALHVVSDDAQTEGSTQEVSFRWTSLMNTLLGLAEPSSGPSGSSNQGPGEQPAGQGLVKLSDPQPLGKAWIGLTTSMLRPVSMPAQQYRERNRKTWAANPLQRQ